MANPNVNQGTLNRLRGNVVIPSHPSLNIAAYNLGENGMSLAFDGNSTDMINTLTGRVTSPVPYLPATLTVPLLKTQALANQYKAQMESLSLIGDITVYTDSSSLSEFKLQNCAIEKVEPGPINGKEATMMVTIAGTYAINDQLYTL
ncbi:MAG TPA: hypothetical protein VFM46_03310 [Pseudomonadales bacterium]|nr:hypothetical protein [Pseudomonadales bacterium]